MMKNTARTYLQAKLDALTVPVVLTAAEVDAKLCRRFESGFNSAARNIAFRFELRLRAGTHFGQAHYCPKPVVSNSCL